MKNNPVAKNFQKFNKNKVEQDRKKEEKKCGYFHSSRLDILLEMNDDTDIKTEEEPQDEKA